MDPSFAEDAAERDGRADNGPWPVDHARAAAENRCAFCLRLNPADPCVCADQEPCDPFAPDRDDDNGQPSGCDPEGPASRDVGDADAQATKEPTP